MGSNIQEKIYTFSLLVVLLDLLLKSYKLSKVLFHSFMMVILSKVKEIQLSEIYIQIYALSCRYNISS